MSFINDSIPVRDVVFKTDFFKVTNDEIYT